MEFFKSFFDDRHSNKKKRESEKRKHAKGRKSLTFDKLEPRQLLAADVFINEFLTSNDSGIVDGNNNESDWIELYNAGTSAQDLAGWHLTDDAGVADKWTFPSGPESVLAPGEYLIVFASSDGVQDSDGNFHTNFSLSASGEYIGLTSPDLTVVSEFGLNGTDFPAQQTDVSYGLGPTGNRFFETPTPGNANGTGFAGLVGDTAFSVDRGFYDAPFSVEITSPTAGATIYYTTDGSVPSTGNGQVYTSPVSITGTTNLRAAAFLADYIPTNVDTQTYIFTSDVLTQPADGGVTVDSDRNIDFQVDPDVAFDPLYTQRLLDGLQDIPTVSLTSNVEDIFGNDGLYNNTQTDDLEFPTSVEYILADGTTGFQIDAGLQIAGGASRIPARSVKHSFSLRFRQEYGNGRLNYELFEDSLVTSFNSLQLRAGYNNTFIHSSSDQRDNATLIRDQFIRDSLLAMGQDDAGRGQYTHLYLNGLYWGVYNLHERADSAHYAEYQGGDADDFDSRNGNNFNGVESPTGTINNVSYQQLRNAAANGTWQEVQERLDVENFIDWTLIQQYNGNADIFAHQNWRAAGGGSANGQWRFYAWDSERTLENPNIVLPGDGVDASQILDDLINRFPEFVQQFEDRIQLHYFNGGALTEAALTERWNARMDELDLAIVAESARWGDARRSEPYTRDVEWIAANQEVLTEFFPDRADIVISTYQGLDLFSDVDAPIFEINGTVQSGGEITAGASLGFEGVSSGSGPTIYYTTDGSDPRSPDGSINPDASGNSTLPFILDTTTNVHARTFSNGEWSPVHEATFVVSASQSELRISEINFNPAAPNAAEIAAGFTDNDDFEFIEIFNPAVGSSINLDGVQLSNGVMFDFGDVELLPGERVVVVEDTDAFMARYGDSATVLGQWSGSLSNSGEEVTLLDSSMDEIMSVNYGDNDPWHNATDGFGFSLVLEDPANTPVAELGKYYRWRASTEFGGTPGAGSADPIGVVVNEVLAHTDLPQSDSIELFNPTSSPINVGGWYLSDEGDDLLKFQIPAGTVIAADGYLVFDESDFNASASGFALSGSEGDQVYLSQVAGGFFIGLQDTVEFDATFNGESVGRLPNGSGRLTRLASPSLGSANGDAEVGPLVISEINYHPGDPNSAALNIDSTLTDDDLEYIEIANPTSAAIDLTEWRIRGEADFDFAAGTVLGAGQAILVVSFDPAQETVKLAAFQAHYGISDGVTIVGGLSESLSNSTGRIALQQPDAADPLGDIPHVVVDEIVYDDLAPWPAADGSGQSLERDDLGASGNFASSWISASPTPGAFESPFLLGDASLDGVVDFRDISPFISLLSNGMFLDQADTNRDGEVNFLDIRPFILLLSS